MTPCLAMLKRLFYNKKIVAMCHLLILFAMTILSGKDIELTGNTYNQNACNNALIKTNKVKL
jgi:hypothetical protein